MKYQFRPYAKMQPSIVTLTGKVYEKGEHPLYTEYKIIEVVDEEGEIYYAVEDELTSDELEQQERSYSEEDIRKAYFEGVKSTGEGWNAEYANYNDPNVEEVWKQEFKDWFEQFKKK